MPLVSHARREIHLKIVYYGPGLGGKTTNLEVIYQRTRQERRGKLVSLTTDAERTLFFDLLPVQLGTFQEYGVRLHLCTVPGQIAHDDTRRLVLRHVDGLVFVADSQASRLEANKESLASLERNLRLQGDDPTRMPLVVQWNKRDLPDALSLPDLRRELQVPDGMPQVEAVAMSGVGVFETAKVALKECLRALSDPREAPEGRSPSVLPERDPSTFPPPASAEGRELLILDLGRFGAREDA